MNQLLLKATSDWLIRDCFASDFFSTFTRYFLEKHQNETTNGIFRSQHRPNDQVNRLYSFISRHFQTGSFDVDAIVHRLIKRRAQFQPQVLMRQFEQILRRGATSYAQVTSRAI